MVTKVNLAMPLLRREIERWVVQAATGHERLATTSRYVGLVREQMDQQLQENAL